MQPSLTNKLSKENIPSHINITWEKFRNALEETAEEVMGRTQEMKRNVKGLPHNVWFDEECKEAKQQLRSVPQATPEWTTAMKRYTALKRKKRREYELHNEA